MNRKTILSAVLLLLLAAGGCASAGPRLAELDAEQLFNHAMERYRAGKWRDAAEAFERFTFEHPDHPRYQEARFQLAEARFGLKEYITAATEYGRLAADFPAGPWADDARFKVCESYYRLSPRVELDQEYTSAAIDHCNALLSYHPDSPFVPRAGELIAELTNKLAEKLLLTGAYYQRRNAFDSAIKYYQMTSEQYPATPYAPRALLRLFRVYQRLEYRDEAEATRQKLLTDYPSSPEARELGGTASGT